jgi:hypothetical protein
VVIPYFNTAKKKKNPTTIFWTTADGKASPMEVFPHSFYLSSFLGSTVQFRPWPPPQNPAEFLGGFSTIFFFTGWGC